MFTANSDRYNVIPYVRCGESGLKLPSLSLGLWHNFGDNADFENMKKVLEAAYYGYDINF